MEMDSTTANKHPLDRFFKDKNQFTQIIIFGDMRHNEGLAPYVVQHKNTDIFESRRQVPQKKREYSKGLTFLGTYIPCSSVGQFQFFEKGGLCKNVHLTILCKDSDFLKRAIFPKNVYLPNKRTTNTKHQKPTLPTIYNTSYVSDSMETRNPLSKCANNPPPIQKPEGDTTRNCNNGATLKFQHRFDTHETRT